MRNRDKHARSLSIFASAAMLLFILPLAAFPLQTIILRVRGHKIMAEVARTEAERSKGLMDRHSLPEDHGMLFVFGDSEIRYFWMKNTFIPLDIAFLDSKGKILVIKKMEPLDLATVSSDKPCRYALEVNQGYYEKIHAQIGDTIHFSSAGK